MAAVHPEPLVFNHATGQLFSADGWTRLCVAALAGLTKLTAPLGYHGLSHACRSLRWALPRRDLIVTLTPDALFTAPLGDPYWTRLLNRRVLYEPEIAAFLRMVADVDYDFIDCCANFGYWSILASSKAYGGHRAVAIEPAKANVRRLDFNARLNGSRFAVLHRAVGEVDKARAWLSGRKHEGMTVVGEGGPGAESVSIVSLDRLLEDGVIGHDRPTVVKLDVEGNEVAALAGARQVLSGDVAVICEDHPADPSHRVTRFLMDEPSFDVFIFDQRQQRFTPLSDLRALEALKARATSAANVIATGPRWTARLMARQSAPARAA